MAPKREGLINLYKTPGIPLRNKIGAAALVLATGCGAFLQWDVVQSSGNPPDIAPRAVMAKGSISCKGARALISVFAGYGIQNNELTAEKIVPIANREGICTQWIDNGNNINVPAVGDAIVAVAEENDISELIGVGESVGGLEVAETENYIIAKHGNKFRFAGNVLDASPGGKNSLKWVNQTIAEKVAEYCQYIQVGDITMTAVTLLTDPNEMRRLHPLKYWTPVYDATRSASMRLRTAQSCMAGVGFRKINEDADTNIFYLRAANKEKDPIVDVEIAEKEIGDQTDPRLFHPVLMYGKGITHASAWDNWDSYERYYDEVIKKISQIIELRQESRWYSRYPSAARPR